MARYSPSVLPRLGYQGDPGEEIARIFAENELRKQRSRQFETEQAMREEELAGVQSDRRQIEAAQRQAGQNVPLPEYLRTELASAARGEGPEPISPDDLSRVADVREEMPTIPLQPRAGALEGERPVEVGGRVYDPTQARLLQEELGGRAADVETTREMDRAMILGQELEAGGLVPEGRGPASIISPQMATSVETSERAGRRQAAELEEARMRENVRLQIEGMRLGQRDAQELLRQTNAEWRRMQQQNTSDPEILLGRRAPHTYNDAFEAASQQLQRVRGSTRGGEAGGGQQGGGTAESPIERARRRAQELQQQGLSREQIKQRLIEEGLIRAGG